MKVKHLSLILFISFLGVFTSCENCSDHDIKSREGDDMFLKLDNENDYFVFGHYYGQCVGEQCTETFILQNGILYENTKDSYPVNTVYTYENLVRLSNEKAVLATSLLSKIPASLADETSGYIGCPDCADGGGIYIELFTKGEKKFWHIDAVKSQLPEYLHTFVDDVKSTIAGVQ
jgi:hypothetical protein